MRFAYGVNAAQGNDVDPSVQFWRGREGEVDFVFEVGDNSVPVALAYRSGDREASVAAVREFQDEFSSPVGWCWPGIRSVVPSRSRKSPRVSCNYCTGCT
jgi:hypothetical protein